MEILREEYAKYNIMVFNRKKKSGPQIEYFGCFHIQTKYDCDGNEEILFVEFEKPIDVSLLEYLKPFGELVPVTDTIFDLNRENFFRLKN